MLRHDLSAVLAGARLLQRAAAVGPTQALLRGKKLALFSEDDGGRHDGGDAALFRAAAEALGAHVAHIRPSLSALRTPHEVRHAARLLGKLYDAVECQAMPAELVQQIEDDAGVPVYAAATSLDHPTAGLAALLGGSTSPADNRRFVLQAVLLGTIA